MKVYIIIGVYDDGSGYKIPRVHTSKELAIKDTEMLKEVGSNSLNWEIVEMDVTNMIENNMPTIR